MRGPRQRKGRRLAPRERPGFYVTRTDAQTAAQFGGGGIFTLRKARLPFLAIYIAVDDIH